MISFRRFSEGKVPRAGCYFHHRMPPNETQGAIWPLPPGQTRARIGLGKCRESLQRAKSRVSARRGDQSNLDRSNRFIPEACAQLASNTQTRCPKWTGLKSHVRLQSHASLEHNRCLQVTIPFKRAVAGNESSSERSLHFVHDRRTVEAREPMGNSSASACTTEADWMAMSRPLPAHLTV